MAVFAVAPVSLPNGEFASTIFDDEERVWDDERLHKGAAIGAEWGPPRFTLYGAGARGITDVLFNPNALAVSARVRERLLGFTELEFLPIDVGVSAPFFIMHVTTTVEVTASFSVRRAPPPSGNIVELFEFPVGYAPASSFFRVRQPVDSAGGRGGYCLRTIYVTEQGAAAVKEGCGAFLEANPVPNSTLS